MTENKDKANYVGAYLSHIERAVAEAATRHDIFKKVMATALGIFTVWGGALFGQYVQTPALLWLPIIGAVMSGYLFIYDAQNYAREKAHINAAVSLEGSISPYSTASVMQGGLKKRRAIQTSAVGLFLVFAISALITTHKLGLL